jgi:hypothetical protein
VHKGNVCVSIDSPHLKLWETFPRDNGYTKYFAYVPKHRLPAYEEAWRAWCSEHDRKDWPQMIFDWAEEKKRLQK